jgi:hypothetical protein
MSLSSSVRLPLDCCCALEPSRSNAKCRNRVEPKLVGLGRVKIGSFLGNKVKRCAVSLGGFAYGVGLTWVSLWVLGDFHWTRHQDRTVTGCHEIGKCPFPWWGWILLVSYLFGPSIILATLNAVAWHRWSVTKWACCCVGITVLALGLYAADYLV